MHTRDWWAAMCWVGVSMLGPWTMTVCRLFGASEWERASVIDMSTSMLRKAPRALASNIPMFVLTPLLFVAWRRLRPRGADVLQSAIATACEIASAAALPLLLWGGGGGEASTPNVTGELLVMDLVTMYATHVLLIFGAQALPPRSLAGGPLFGLARHLRDGPEARPSSLPGGIFALYANVGALHRGFRLMSSLLGDERAVFA